MKKHVEILAQEIVYQGFFRLERYRLRHTLFKGGWSVAINRELFERGHAAAVLLYDPQLDRVVLIEQFRIGALQATDDPWLMELVAGVIEVGEDGEAVARRESVEEADCIIQELELICEYLVSPGGTSERIQLFCGRVDASQAGGIHGLEEEHEDIRVHVIGFTEAVDWLTTGRLDSASPIIALQWLMMNRQRLRTLWGDCSHSEQG